MLGLCINNMSLFMHEHMRLMHRHPNTVVIIVAIVSVNPSIMVGVSGMHRDPGTVIIVSIVSMDPSVVIQR